LSNARNLTLETDVGAVDLLGDITGVSSFEDLWERVVEMDLGGGLSVRVASLDDLIAMKRAADRPKDRLHLMELEALRRLVREEA
jgi:predicted nucleotidyltransferase